MMFISAKKFIFQPEVRRQKTEGRSPSVSPGNKSAMATDQEQGSESPDECLIHPPLFEWSLESPLNSVFCLLSPSFSMCYLAVRRRIVALRKPYSYPNTQKDLRNCLQSARYDYIFK